MNRKNSKKDAKPVKTLKTKKEAGQTAADPTRGGKKRRYSIPVQEKLEGTAATSLPALDTTLPSLLDVAAALPAAQPEKLAINRRNAIHDKKGKELGQKVAQTLEGEQSADPTTPNTARSAAVPTGDHGGSSLTAKLQGRRMAELNGRKDFGGRTPTQEQQAIIDLVSEGLAGCLVVEAGAGCGKTATQVMISQVMPGRGQYTARNTDLVADGKRKFGANVDCNTTHSLAFRAVGYQYANRLPGEGKPRLMAWQIADILGIEDIKVQVDTSWTKAKLQDLANPTVGASIQERTLARNYLAGQVMGAIKLFQQSADKEISAKHFRYIDGIDNPCDSTGRRSYTNNEKVRQELLPFAQAYWADLLNPEGQLPFTHDAYVKIWQLSKPVISADYILLDEDQDTAPVFADVLKQQKCPIILVGDENQIIYEWAGAINAAKLFPSAPMLWLTQSFRFGQAVADVANSILETLEHPTQLRLKGLPSIPSKIESLASPKAILCRTNAVAIARFLNAIAEGKKPFLVGGSKDVISFVEAALALQSGKGTSHPDLACFNSWIEVQQYVTLDEGEDLKLMVKLVDEFGAQTILDGLRRMPAEKDADMVISTAHKSKGREWESVQLASDFKTKSKCSDSEKRLLYVAATRAKVILDIYQCPFFTGDDSMPITFTPPGQPLPSEPTSVIPPAPIAPPKPQEFTWSKGRQGDWLIRGPAGKSGAVEVVRKDGSRSKKTLGTVVWEDGNVALYKTN